MKKITLFLLSLCVLLASLTACSGGRQHKTSTVKAVEFDDFVKKDSDEEGILGSFNLQDYLEAYGAIFPKENRIEHNSLTITAHFENGIVVSLFFCIGGYNNDKYDEYGHLDNIMVYCTSDDNVELPDTPTDYTDGMISIWARKILPQNNGFTDNCYRVVGDSVYIEKDDEKIAVTVPDDFDEEFRKSVAPYLEIKRPSYTMDPLFSADN